MRKFLLCTFYVFALGNTVVQAQVHTAGTSFSFYSDIDPDTLMHYATVPFTNNVYSFDVTGDSIPDLEFTARGSVSSGGTQAFIRVRSIDPALFIRFGRWDSVYAPGSGSWFVTKVAEPLDSGEVINTITAVWDTSEMYLTDHTGTGGAVKDVNDWIGTEKYLALKYDDSQTENYGWMRIECPSADSCYVMDLSFTQDPIGYARHVQGKVKIYPNPSYDMIHIEGENISEVEVRDISGKILIREKSSRIIPVTDLKPGTYLLNVIKHDGIEKMKFVRR